MTRRRRRAPRPLLPRSPTTCRPVAIPETVPRPRRRPPLHSLLLSRRRFRRPTPQCPARRRARLRSQRRRCRRPTPRSDHLLQAADLPLVAFPLSGNHPTICVIDFLLGVGGFERDIGCHHDVGATVVVPPLHPSSQSGALGGLGLGDLDQDLVVLVVILLGEIPRRVS